jgi:ferredoxin
MKTTIYYFTGTGNSLAMARELCAYLSSSLDECKLVPIASIGRKQDAIILDADRIGIVCPVYNAGLPIIVAEFAERLTLPSSSYVFSIITMRRYGTPALNQLNAVFKRHAGRGMDSGFTIRMPVNYIMRVDPPDEKERNEILAKADKRIKEIADSIASGAKMPPKAGLFSSFATHLLYNGFRKNVHGSDKKFCADKDCISCGACARVCPVKNITLIEGKPTWSHHCELCCACIQLCPTSAIQYGKKTATRKRYKHPALSVADMKKQRGD